jgi:rhodanese-related sulfurtransferase
VLLDVREPHEFASGHVPGARSLPQADLATRLSEVPRDRPIFVICQGGFRSLRAAQFLNQVGFKDVVSVKGGTEAWRAAQKALATGGSDSDSEPPRFIESEWAHAGGLSYEI